MARLRGEGKRGQLLPGATGAKQPTKIIGDKRTQSLLYESKGVAYRNTCTFSILAANLFRSYSHSFIPCTLPPKRGGSRPKLFLGGLAPPLLSRRPPFPFPPPSSPTSSPSLSLKIGPLTAGGSGERCKLSRGHRTSCILAIKPDIWWHQSYYFF